MYASLILYSSNDSTKSEISLSTDAEHSAPTFVRIGLE